MVTLSRCSAPATECASAVAPPIVDRVLSTAGRPLPSAVRANMELRFAHDFRDVRVHDDARAAASAAAVGARAWTVGRHIAFGRREYRPDSPAGARLLAHELAHVVQQRAAAPAGGAPRIGPADDGFEREAAQAAEHAAAPQTAATARQSASPVLLRRHSISPEPRLVVSGREEEDDQVRSREDDARASAGVTGGGGADFGVALSASVVRLQRVRWGDDLPGGGWQEKHEAAAIRAQAAAERECLEQAGPDPAECDPATPLTWADFTGSPAGGTHDAATFSSLQERPINVGLLRCMPDRAPEGTPSQGIQAVFDRSRSWVRPRFANSTDPAQNGCADVIAACRTHFDRGAARGHVGVDFSMSTEVRPRCPAAALPRGDTAHRRDDCATVVASDCTDRATAESQRLLRHEQGHFDLTCAMARKANQMLGATDFAALLRGARAALRTAQARYDAQTRHGCNPDQQAAWEAAIAAGLPDVAIAVRQPRRPRR